MMQHLRLTSWQMDKQRNMQARTYICLPGILLVVCTEAIQLSTDQSHSQWCAVYLAVIFAFSPLYLCNEFAKVRGLGLFLWKDGDIQDKAGRVGWGWGGIGERSWCMKKMRLRTGRLDREGRCLAQGSESIFLSWYERRSSGKTCPLPNWAITGWRSKARTGPRNPRQCLSINSTHAAGLRIP